MSTRANAQRQRLAWILWMTATTGAPRALHSGLLPAQDERKASLEEASVAPTVASAPLWPRFVGEACWIVSEVCWILLVPQLCIPAGIAAFVFIAYAAVLDIRSGGLRRPCVWLPEVLQSFWLMVNVVWMSEELFWDSPDQQTPWALTPLLGEDDDLFDQIQSYCIGCFLAVPAVWLSLMCLMVVAYGCPTRRSYHPARVLLFEAGYISIWSLMDGLWALGLLWPALASGLVTIVLIFASAAAETGLGIRGTDRTDVVWILWTLSNLLWIAMELEYDDDLNLRYTAAGVGLVGLVTLLCSWSTLKRRTEWRKSAETRAADGTRQLARESGRGARPELEGA